VIVTGTVPEPCGAEIVMGRNPVYAAGGELAGYVDGIGRMRHRFVAAPAAGKEREERLSWHCTD
jgi:hypothetical protein